MRGLVGLLCLLFLLGIGSAQDGTLRVIVRDEHSRPIQAIVRFHPQIYDFCKPWNNFTLSSWHSLFLSYAWELGREPSLKEWQEWLVKMGMVTREQTKMVTDENGQIAWSVRPGIYSVYAWSPGYGVACAHHVLVRPAETTEVALTLSRVPITMLQAHLVFPQPPLSYSSLKLMQNGARLFTHYLLSEFVQFPLAQWHPRSPNPLSLGEFTAVFEADGMEARKSFRLEKWGEVINLGTIEFSSRPPKPETDKEVTVTVQVFWSDGKTPARGVAVGYMNVMTDQQGRVQLELPLGGNEIRIYVPKQFWHKGVSPFHWLYITPETKQVKIVLPKPAKVHGLVQYENGAPAVNAEVSMDLLKGGGVEFHMPELRTRTDEKGAFSFPAVPPGRFILRVQDGLISFRRFISVQSGQDIRLTINLRPPQMRWLTGEIKLPSGEPASKAVVVMFAMELLFADEQGRFITKRRVTEEPLFVWMPGKGLAFRWLLIPPSPEPLAFPIVLESGCVLGRIVDEHNRPVPMASVKLLRSGFYFTGLLAAHTDAEGMFKISPVPSGEWDLIIEGPPKDWLPIPVLVGTIPIPPSGVIDVGTLRVSTKVGRIVGRVVFPDEFGKGEGQSTVRIRLQPEKWFDQWEFGFGEVSSSNPEFYCFPLPPGNYWLLARGGGWSSPPQKVNIPETGGDVSVIVPLRKAGSLRVFVYDGKTGKPISASARVVNAEGVELAYEFTDSEGEALLEDIPPGRHVLQVWGALYRSIKLPVHIVAGQARGVTVRLEPKL